MHQVHVGSFEIDTFNVTNGQFMEFVEAGGYSDPVVAATRTGRGCQAGVDAPAFWEREAMAGSGAACSSACCCPGLARLRDVGRSACLRALAESDCPPKRNTSRRVRNAGGS